MKRLLFLSLSILLLGSTAALGAGTCTQVPATTVLMDQPTSVTTVTLDCTGDASDGTFASVAILDVGGFLMPISYEPGATLPTNLFDITISTSDGVDLLRGEGANITAAAAAKIGEDPEAFSGDLSVAITGTSVNSSRFLLVLPFAR